MSIENSLFDKIYQVAREIPKGRVTSYGAIAKAIGSPQSARTVGWAMNASPEDVPAHRVVNRNGLLSGKSHFGDSNAMQNLLEAEGITVKNNQIQDFKELFWEPEIFS